MEFGKRPYALVSCDGGRYLSERIDLLLRDDPCYAGFINSEEHHYPVGEIKPVILKQVRHLDVYVVQGMYSPTLEWTLNDNIIAMAATIDALKRATAGDVNAVIPYYPYSRQERRSGKEYGRREPVTARLVADLLQSVKTNKVITLDIHTEAIEGFFSPDCPLDNFYPTKQFVPALFSRMEELSIPKELADFVSLDYGGMKRSGVYSRRMDMKLTGIHKVRDAITSLLKKEESKVMGNIKGKYAIASDDIIDTAGSVVDGFEILMKDGALGMLMACSIPLLRGPALQRLDGLYERYPDSFKGIIGTDAIWQGEDFNVEHPWYSYVELAPTLAKIIKTNQTIGGSLHDVLD